MESCPKDYNLEPIENFEQLVKKLHEIFEDNEIDTDYVKAVMNSYKSKECDWAQYAKFDEYR